MTGLEDVAPSGRGAGTSLPRALLDHVSGLHFTLALESSQPPGPLFTLGLEPCGDTAAGGDAGEKHIIHNNLPVIMKHKY